MSAAGLVTSEIEQAHRLEATRYNAKLAPDRGRTTGSNTPYPQVRYEASYGAEYQHESTSFSLALLLAHPAGLKVIAAVHPGLWQPGRPCQAGAPPPTTSPAAGFAVNVVSGWFRDEFTHLGEPWLEHDERYRRSAEFPGRCFARSGPEDDRPTSAGDLLPQSTTSPSSRSR